MSVRTIGTISSLSAAAFAAALTMSAPASADTVPTHFGTITAQQYSQGGSLFCDDFGATVQVVVDNGVPHATYRAGTTAALEGTVIRTFVTDANGDATVRFSNVLSADGKLAGTAYVTVVTSGYSAVWVPAPVLCHTSEGG